MMKRHHFVRRNAIEMNTQPGAMGYADVKYHPGGK